MLVKYWDDSPNSKVHGAYMGPIWGRQDPDGPHVGPMNFDIWEAKCGTKIVQQLFLLGKGAWEFCYSLSDLVF